MTSMLCPAPDRLKAFYLGQLPDEQSDELATHVSICEVCQTELESGANSEDSLISQLREKDECAALDEEPACEAGILRALGALADVHEAFPIEADPSESEKQLLPKSIGEYEVVRSLGQGGMGRVYLARHNKLGRLVALKVLAGHRLGDHRAIQRFESEMKVVGRLSHPNIVIAHDARDVEGTALLVTEFIDGLDLGQLLHRTGVLEVADACEIIRQVAIALQYTSDQGFVHRDVKPSNIMLSHLGEVKLLDLGLARLQYVEFEASDITGTGQTMGTADYISPEQVTDSSKVDVRSDLYALGATLFKLLTGRAPFADDKFSTAFAKMTAHVSATPPSLRKLRREVPIELERLVESMLSKRPEDRPKCPDIVAEKLGPYCHGSNLTALIQRAKSKTITPNAPKAPSPVDNKTRTESFWHRPIKFYIGVASGFLGLLIGLSLGIIITITNRDGTKTTVTVPDGSKVEITETGSAPKSSMMQAMSPSPTQDKASAKRISVPLQFALLVQRESSKRAPFIADKELERMLEQLPRTNSSAVVKSDRNKFVRIGESPSEGAPISAWNNGEQYALVATEPQYSIPWEDIVGRVLESDFSVGVDHTESTLSLKFDESLGAKMKSLSSAGIGLQLAIIVDDTIVQAPRINSEIGSTVKITGRFSASQLQNMRQYLNLSQATTANQITTVTVPVESVEVQSYDVEFGIVLDALASALNEKRTAIVQRAELEAMVNKIATSRGWRSESNAPLKRAIAVAWPFRSIQSVERTLPNELIWLRDEMDTPWTVHVSRDLLLADIRSLTEGWTGVKGGLDSILERLKKEPEGPKIDIERDLLSRMGDQMIFFSPSEAFAIEMEDVTGLEELAQRWSSLGDGSPKLIGKHLFFGPRKYLEAATTRYEAMLLDKPSPK